MIQNKNKLIIQHKEQMNKKNYQNEYKFIWFYNFPVKSNMSMVGAIQKLKKKNKILYILWKENLKLNIQKFL